MADRNTPDYSDFEQLVKDMAAHAVSPDIEKTMCEKMQREVEVNCSGWLYDVNGSFKCVHHGQGTCPQCDKDEARSQYLMEIGFGSRYAQPDLKKLFGNQKEANAAAKQVTDFITNCKVHADAGEGLMLLGQPGTGKTFALALIALAARRDGYAARYIYAPTLFDMMFDKSPETKTEVRNIERVDMLLLDDIGASHDSNFPLAGFNALIERRHSNVKSTCIASNLTIAQLCSLPGYERAVSRWHETCAGRIIILGEGVQDMRKAR